MVRGSSVLYPTAEDLHAHRAEFSFGRHGSPTTRALQDALMSLEGPQCAGIGLAPSGLAAITTTLLSVLSAGDHVLVTDNVYRPSRNFCNGMLARYGVEVSSFDPLIGAGIESLSKPNTRAMLSPHRPGECRRPQGRSRSRFCGVEGRRVKLQPRPIRTARCRQGTPGAAVPDRTLRAFVLARRRHRIFAGGLLTTRSP